MNNNTHQHSDAQDEDHDFELSEMQRKVVAVAIDTAEAAITAREHNHGPTRIRRCGYAPSQLSWSTRSTSTPPNTTSTGEGKTGSSTKSRPPSRR